jgi:hypothetical protein
MWFASSRLACARVPCNQSRDARGDGSEEGRHDHDGLVGKADCRDCVRAEMADHERIDQPYGHVEQLFTDCRQRQRQDAAIVTCAQQCLETFLWPQTYRTSGSFQM